MERNATVKSKILNICVSIPLVILSTRDAFAHTVIVHEQITSNAVFCAQLYSSGYTNFINTISVPSAFLAQAPYISLLYQPQSPQAFNIWLTYKATMVGQGSKGSNRSFAHVRLTTCEGLPMKGIGVSPGKMTFCNFHSQFSLRRKACPSSIFDAASRLFTVSDGTNSTIAGVKPKFGSFYRFFAVFGGIGIS